MSLNLILGYGGMMSFGHAAYLGIGGYAVGILAHEGDLLRLRAVAGGARRLGALRAGDRRAVAAHARRLFHHDHLAFAQMAYYVVAGLARYGGDDGLTIYKRSQSSAPSTSPTRRNSTMCAWRCCLHRSTWCTGW